MDIEAVQALQCNEDFNVSVEANDEDATSDFSRTRVIPEVPSDKESDKENRTKTLCPSSRDDPDVTFDIDSNMDDGEIGMSGNTNNIQDAFIFCPIMGSITMDKALD